MGDRRLRRFMDVGSEVRRWFAAAWCIWEVIRGHVDAMMRRTGNHEGDVRFTGGDGKL